MRTQGPNRHAAELSDFMESVQSEINRARSAQGSLDEVGILELLTKLTITGEALMGHMIAGKWWAVGKAAEILTMYALGIWMWTRRKDSEDE